MKVHLMLDSDRSNRLCDGKPLERPLPHVHDVWKLCTACESVAEQLDAAGNQVVLGLALSFAKR